MMSGALHRKPDRVESAITIQLVILIESFFYRNSTCDRDRVVESDRVGDSDLTCDCARAGDRKLACDHYPTCIRDRVGDHD